MARNANFQSVLGQVAQAALAGLPADVSGDGVAPLSSLPLPGSSTPVSAAVTELVAKVGENIVLRRAAKISAPGGLVCTYTHNAASPGLGATGVLVALVPGKGAAAVAKGTPAYTALHDFGRKLAMHVAASRPSYLSRASIPPADIDRERAIAVEQGKGSGKPENILAKIAEGRISKWVGETTLLEQPFAFSDEGHKVSKVLQEVGKKAGVSVEVGGFLAFKVGETAAAK